jgi:hypothetical protein
MDYFSHLKAIDCGRVQTILKGEVTYVNSTTYLGSQLMYSCSTGYRLVGTKTRICNDDSRWSGGNTPKCEGQTIDLLCCLHHILNFKFIFLNRNTMRSA